MATSITTAHGVRCKECQFEDEITRTWTCQNLLVAATNPRSTRVTTAYYQSTRRWLLYIIEHFRAQLSTTGHLSTSKLALFFNAEIHLRQALNEA